MLKQSQIIFKQLRIKAPKHPLYLALLAGCGGTETKQILPDTNDKYTTDSNIISGEGYIRGTNSADIIRGSQIDDRIYGFDGDDIIETFMGDDTVFAGVGDDTILVTDSDTIIDGGLGFDALIIEGMYYSSNVNIDLTVGTLSSSDLIGTAITELKSIEVIEFNGATDIEITTSSGAERIQTGNGNAIVFSKGQGDEIITGDGIDRIYVESASSQIQTGAGQDEIYLNVFADTISMGGGHDKLIISFDSSSSDLIVDFGSGSISDSIRSTSFFGVEEIQVVGAENTRFIGSYSNQSMIGGEGNDTLIGNGGHDTFKGSGGSDTFVFTSTGYTEVLDFNFLDENDLIGLDQSIISSTGITNITYLNLSDQQRSPLTVSSEIYIVTDAPPLNNENELLALLLGSSGVYPITGSVFLNQSSYVFWYNQQSNAAEVSIISDTNQNNVFDQLINVGMLYNVQQSDLEQMTSENFVLA